MAAVDEILTVEEIEQASPEGGVDRRRLEVSCGRRSGVGPGGGSKPFPVGFGKARIAGEAFLPRLGAVDEVIRYGRDFAFEIEEEKIAHEIEARRQRHKAALQQRVERTLVIEFA